MNYSRQIHDYLDGELAFQNEEQLFAEVASNPEVRADFNTQMKIHLVAKQDMSVIAPPSSVTNAVFANLGFSPPISTSNQLNDAKTGFIPIVYKFLKKSSVALLLLMLFTSISTGVYFAYQNSVLEDKLNSNNKKSIAIVKSESLDNYNTDISQAIEGNNVSNNSIIDLNSTFSNSNSNLNNQKSGSNLNKFRNSSLNNNAHYSNSFINSNSALASNSLNSNDDGIIASNFNKNLYNNINESSIVNSNYNVNILISNSNSNNNQTNIIGLGNVFGSLNSLIDLISIDNTNYSIQIRGLVNSEKMPSYSVVNNDLPFYSNFSIGGSYKLNTYHSIGLEVGSEQFNQKFSLSNGLDYSQSPELLWAGISYRFTPKDWLIPYTLYPYSELFAGGTTVGPLFRVQAGVNYMIYNNIGVSFGVEYGVLYYNVENNIHNSQKYGITSGVNFNF